MKAKLIIEGKEFDIEINNPELEKMIKPKKKTGYERVENGDVHYYDEGFRVAEDKDCYGSLDDEFYNGANYYSDKIVAENNTRADKLMRQLRRFAVEHRKTDLKWECCEVKKYCLRYEHDLKIIRVDYWYTSQAFGGIWFDSEEATKLAIQTFYDELIWYFTEYKDSL